MAPTMRPLPAEVRAHVREVFAHLGTPAGGLIACGEISPDTPLENIRALIDGFGYYRKCGRGSA